MICDIFAENGNVIIEDDVHGRTVLAPKEALLRAYHVIQSEMAGPRQTRNKKSLALAEATVAAAVEAKQQKDPSYIPPQSVVDLLSYGFRPAQIAVK